MSSGGRLASPSEFVANVHVLFDEKPMRFDGSRPPYLFFARCGAGLDGGIFVLGCAQRLFVSL